MQVWQQACIFITFNHGLDRPSRPSYPIPARRRSLGVATALERKQRVSNTERKKEIDNITDLLERAKGMVEDMKSENEDQYNAMEEELKEAHQGDEDEPEATQDMKNIELTTDYLEEAISYIEDAIDAVIRAE